MAEKIRYRAQPIDLGMVGIATTYAGVQFRSRLEARWAATFDVLRWPWDYEPFDLSGYVPDFILNFRRAPLLVEVKPDLSFDALAPHSRRICLSGWRRDFLILGAGPLDLGRMFGSLWLYEHDAPPGEWLPGAPAIAHRCLRCREVSMHHENASWHCMVCGAYDGGRLIGALDGEVLAAWREAGNRVQWKAT